MSQVGRSTSPAEAPPKLRDFEQERIRTLHYTWIAFFMTFYVWFNMAPMATTMLDSIGWLTEEHVKILLIANVALTIPVRIIVGALIDRFGARGSLRARRRGRLVVECRIALRVVVQAL